MATPVRVEATTYEIVWMTFDDLALPGFEDDRPQVLAPPPVLGKQPWPLIRVRVDDDDRRPTPVPYAVAGYSARIASAV
jgi:hypothetical protein